MHPQSEKAIMSSDSPAQVLQQKIAHQRRFGSCSNVYMSMVRKWRFHFYGVIHKVFENANEFDFPIAFSPLAQYLDGFTVEYHEINDLPPNLLADLRAEDEVEEGWNFIHEGTIHIFYDPSVNERRRRFTIAHEWGHVFQKLDWEFKSDMEAIVDEKERKEIIESVANHFAAYYLVPFPLFKREYEEAIEVQTWYPLNFRLADRFDVSENVITNHMTNFRKRLQQ